MTTFLVISVALLVVALTTTIVSLFRAKDGFEDAAGFHPAARTDASDGSAVGRIVRRAPAP